MSIHRFVEPGPAETAAACAHQILAHLENALLGSDEATFAISGGKSPVMLFGELVKARFDWSRVHIFWADERCVPPSHELSNYRLADEVFLRPAHVPHRNVHRVHGELQPDAAARAYRRELEGYFGLEPGGIPHFDVLHLGVGDDGHTASLFPRDPKIEDREDAVAAVHAESLGQHRVTILPAVILAAKHIVLYSVGASKAAVVHDILESAYEPSRLPAQLVRHGRNVSWFLDQAAAARMS